MRCAPRPGSSASCRVGQAQRQNKCLHVLREVSVVHTSVCMRVHAGTFERVFACECGLSLCLSLLAFVSERGGGVRAREQCECSSHHKRAFALCQPPTTTTGLRRRHSSSLRVKRTRRLFGTLSRFVVYTWGGSAGARCASSFLVFLHFHSLLLLLVCFEHRTMTASSSV